MPKGLYAVLAILQGQDLGKSSTKWQFHQTSITLKSVFERHLDRNLSLISRCVDLHHDPPLSTASMIPR